ncbi:MAG: Rrf2 family transcriptional regulator [Firmicutes bacterium]|jgi:Rrf2 family protein|nr:Rrf2 family transcriptional regulator [Bacillota bacterium]
MQITRQTEYAIRTLVELATVPFGQLVSTRAISERQDIPAVFLKKTVQLLAHAGLVQTQRGNQGGVKLAQPPEAVTLADIIAATEGKIALNICLSAGEYCPRQSGCRIRRALGRAQQALLAELEKETLADLAATE